MKWFSFLLVFLLFPLGVQAFAPTGENKKCTDCHKLTVAEAGNLLLGGVDRVIKVERSEVPGFWAVEVQKGDQKFPLYIDFTKQYVFTGNIVRLADKQNITSQRLANLNRIDTAKIPLGDALLLGDAKAKTKVIVFTDPECPYCKKLHEELKEVVRRDPSIAFLIKLFPLQMHPNAYTISKSIVCNKSMAMLEDSFAGKTVPPPLCETKVIDQNIVLAQELGIRSTPTLVLPDGMLLPGYKKADDLLKQIGTKTPETGKKK
jgi:thiol:disulfide interchange protein DsbC